MTPEDLVKDMYRFLEVTGQKNRFKDWAIENNIYSEEDVNNIETFIEAL